MESIECPTKAPCGHSFHFECLFRWGRKHNSCPLCRGKLVEEEQHEEEELEWGGSPRQLFVDTSVGWARAREITREAQQRYQDRLLSQYTGEAPDPIDVELIMQQTGVERRRVEVFLKYFEYDIVDTIIFLKESRNEFAIPDYRERVRPHAPAEYTKRNTEDRVIHQRVDGYESA